MKHILLFISISLITICISSQELKHYSFEKAFELAQNNPKKIVVDVYTDWCGWCKVMDRNTFNHEIIAEYLNKNFYFVKLNAEQKDSIVLGNKTYKWIDAGRNGIHELAYALLQGKLGYPSVVFLDEKFGWLQMKQGYTPPKDFNLLLKFYGENHYKSKTYKEFVKEYTSQL